MGLTSIDILLATFNGAKWLPALLASLDGQTCQDWCLLVRDDGSSDGTLEILQAWQDRLGDRMTWIDGPKSLPGALGNFAQLLATSTAPYIMLCDQDDVWLPAKVETAMAAMTSREAIHGVGTPILIFTDLMVVDADLRTLAPSFWKDQSLVPTRATFPRLLVQNVVTGCTTMANRALVRRACPIPPGAFMHDWWLALVAGAFGRLEPLGEAQILYRQHEANLIGAPPFSLFKNLDILLRGTYKTYLQVASLQAAALLERFGESLGDRYPSTQALANLNEQSWLTQRFRMVAHGFFFYGWLRNLAWLLVS